MHAPATKPLSPCDFIAAAEAMRTDGNSLVLTAGTFDRLDLAELHQLQTAARYGDRLLVAVASDLHVAETQHRAHVRAARVAAMRCVDLVVINIWPEGWLIDALLPEAWVWPGPPEQDLCRRAVTSYGGRVIHLANLALLELTATHGRAAPVEATRMVAPLRVFRGEACRET